MAKFTHDQSVPENIERYMYMRNRLWVIPFTVIVVIIAVWIARWGYMGQEDNRTYYQDRWLRQAWVRDPNDPSRHGHPFIAAEVIDQATQAAINADPALSAQYGALDQEIARQTAVMNANQPFEQEYLDILAHQSMTDVVDLLTAHTTGEKWIPEDVQQGDYLYEQSSYQLISLTQQKEDLWQSTQAAAERSLYDQADRQRRIATNSAAALGIVAVVWLVYLLLIRRHQPISSEPGQAGEKESFDQNLH